MSGIVAARILLVLRKFCLHELKLVLRDDGGHLSHGFPLLRRARWMAAMLVPNRTQGRLSMTRSGDTIATKKDRSGVDRIAHNAPHGRLIPAQLPPGIGNLLTHQVLGQADQTLVFLLKRHAPAGAPLRMKKSRIEGATFWREDDQRYTRANVFLKLCCGVWTNHSMLPPLLQQW
jgi:hypothetical protein